MRFYKALIGGRLVISNSRATLAEASGRLPGRWKPGKSRRKRRVSLAERKTRTRI